MLVNKKKSLNNNYQKRILVKFKLSQENKNKTFQKSFKKLKKNYKLYKLKTHAQKKIFFQPQSLPFNQTKRKMKNKKNMNTLQIKKESIYNLTKQKELITQN